jgi:ATP-dependent 26S proteasome regulatory subunit
MTMNGSKAQHSNSSNHQQHQQDQFYPCQAWRSSDRSGSNGDISSIDLTSSSCSSNLDQESSLPPAAASEEQSASNNIMHDPDAEATHEDSDSDDAGDREDENAVQKRVSWKRVLAGFTLAILWAYWKRRKLHRDRRTKEVDEGAPNRIFPWLSSLFFLLHSKSNTKKAAVVEVNDNNSLSSAKIAPISLLLTLAKQGKIAKALLNNTAVAFLGHEGDSTSMKWHRAKLPFATDAFQSEVLQCLTNGGCNDIAALPDDPSPLSSVLATPLAVAFPFLYLAALYRMMKKLQNDQQQGDDSSKRKTTNRNHQTVMFDNVAGLEDAKIELMEVVQCLRNPQMYQTMGARPPRGVLLHGPTGTGKTLLARAVAGEARCSTFIQCSASDFCEMWVGRGAARVRNLFDNARSQALTHYQSTKQRQAGQSAAASTAARLKRWSTVLPETVASMLGTVANIDDTMNQNENEDGIGVASAIIFIDEIDALAKIRANGINGNDEREQTLNQLLTEMDGFESRESEVTLVVMAATNRPDILDPALLRPGRLDRHVYVGYPNKRGREDILRLHARRIRLDLYSVDLESLSIDDLTRGFTGAELANVVNEAAFLALRQGLSSVTQTQLIQAVQRVSRMKHGGYD